MDVDLNRSDIFLKIVIARRCSVFGHVASVEVRRKPVPIALIKMSRREHAEWIVSHYRGSISGNSALIPLAHKSE